MDPTAPEVSAERCSALTERWEFAATALAPEVVMVEIAVLLYPESQFLTLLSRPNPVLDLDCHIRQENRTVVVTLNHLEIVESRRGKGLGKRVVRKIVETYARHLNPDFGWRVTDVLFVETHLDSFRGVAFLNRIKHQSEKFATFGPCRSRVALKTLPK
ncbi:MAG: hypothetical protein PHX38_13505 [Sulfuricella sp.]|nr:hypothetical protein [Sulfuricella sp.]